MALFPSVLSLETPGTCSHRVGNTILNPTAMMVTPENIFQNVCGMSIKSVEAFKSRVNRMTENEREKMTTRALREIRLPCSGSDDPMTIGRRGRIQGASTVNIPASTDMKKNIILVNLRDYTIEG